MTILNQERIAKFFFFCKYFVGEFATVPISQEQIKINVNRCYGVPDILQEYLELKCGLSALWTVWWARILEAQGWNNAIVSSSSHIYDFYPRSFRQFGEFRRSFSSISGFLKLWVLLNDLSKLTLHHIELTMVNASYVKPEENRSSFKNHFPQWRLIGLAIGSFSITLYGWWYLRNQIKMFWGFCWWCVGIALWVYTVNVWIVHTRTP